MPQQALGFDFKHKRFTVCLEDWTVLILVCKTSSLTYSLFSVFFALIEELAML